MKYTNSTKLKLIKMSILAVIVLMIIMVVVIGLLQKPNIITGINTPETTLDPAVAVAPHAFEGKAIYRDDTRPVTLAEKQFRSAGRMADADSLKVVSSQPGTTWLVGPNTNDPTAKKDIQEVVRTSTQAAAQGTTPVFQLYAIPNRDACANYSKGGFSTPGEYTHWINQIIMSVQTPSVFLLETDSIGNIASKDCLTQTQIREREQLLKDTVEKLRQSPNTLAIYLDAAHSEWFPDTSELIGPLKRSGYGSADGVFVNTSFFVKTEEITKWSKKLLDELGGDNKGVIIDTSRNGNGTPVSAITGEARWCNPKGRSVGATPDTKTGIKYIHAYLWIKHIGESDGSCANNPAAGTFVPEIALELVRNRDK